MPLRGAGSQKHTVLHADVQSESQPQQGLVEDVVLPLNRPAQTSRTWRKRRAKSAAGLDAVYGQFPSAKSLTGLVQKVPAHFLFTFKVTCDITLKCFVNLPRLGIKAGKPYDNFLHANCS